MLDASSAALLALERGLALALLLLLLLPPLSSLLSSLPCDEDGGWRLEGEADGGGLSGAASAAFALPPSASDGEFSSSPGTCARPCSFRMA